MGKLAGSDVSGVKEDRDGRGAVLAVLVLLGVAVFSGYLPVINYEFVKYDDDRYVTENRYVLGGVGWEGVRWAFTTGQASNWHPVTWISHMVDCSLFGTRAGAHHLVNVILHTANTLLLFYVLKRMTKAVWASAFVAAIFGLHPLHIESVAWVAERKDVLSTFFWLMTMWAYSRYAERPKAAGYFLTLLLFAVGLMAKPMLVTLPFVLLLLDYWPLERFKRVHIGRLVVEKIPFFVLSAVSSVVTMIVQRVGGAVPTVEALGVRARVANAVVSYVGYILKMFWPSNLAVLYPHPVGAIPAVAVLLCGLVLAVLTGCFLWLARRRRYFAVGWLWYVGTLVPVIGLVQVGMQAMADRYTYVPMTGLVIIVAWWVRDLTARWGGLRVVASVAAGMVLAASAVCTRLQLSHWRDSASLFEHTLSVTRDNWLIHNNYANVLKEEGKVAEAIEHFNEALRIRPNSAEVYNNLGGALGKAGRTEEEVGCYRKAIELKGDFTVAHYNLAAALVKQGKKDEAIFEYREALRFEPDYVEALSNLGFELTGQGKFSEAIDYYQKALELKPDDVITHGRLGLAYAAAGKIDEAIKECRFVLQNLPNDAEMHFNLGVLLEKQGKIDEAIQSYQQALQINPDYTEAAEHLNAALAKQGKKN